MAHMFFVKPEQMKSIETLARNRIHGQYHVLSQSNGWCDVVMWDEQYKNLKFLVCKSESLDEKKRMF